MKKIIILILVFVSSSIVFAHDAHYEKIILKTWNISKEHKTIDGTFLMYKNALIYIEGSNHQIYQYPLQSFSQEDQLFLTQKIHQVNLINSQENKKNTKNENLTFIILFILTIGIIPTWIYSLKKKNSTNFKYILPIIFMGSSLVLFSFTSSVMKRMNTITDPLYVDSAFAVFKPKVATRWDNTYFHVESKGIPDHEMMTGIKGWQQQFPIPQCYIGNNAWSIPLNPVKAATPIPVNNKHFLRGAVAIAANGVAIFNPYTNTGVDAYLDGQLDNFGGHCGRADDYHYHIAPLFLEGQSAHIVPIAFALDGYAIYGNKEPDGTTMKTLDANHGHDGNNGVYHYHGTKAAPYIIGNMVGQVTEDTTLQIIPQAAASPIRPAGTPLKGAVITGCTPNNTKNGYTLTYTLNGKTDSVEYSWNTTGKYTFNAYVNGVKTTNTYNGFKQCDVGVYIATINALENQISVFPNPAYDYINILLGNTNIEKDIKEISLYNLLGEQVLVIDKYKKTIETNTLSKGTYLVIIKLKDSQITKKIIKQ